MNRRQFHRWAALAGTAALWSPFRVFGEGEPPQSPLDVADEPVLWIDDACIESSAGLRTVLHQPAKQGLIQESDGRDWERGDCYAAEGNAVVRDAAGRFHMTYRYLWWDPEVRNLYEGIREDRAHWFRQTVGYAVSDDGIRWHKPVLGLVDAPAAFATLDEFPYSVPSELSRQNNLGCSIDFLVDLHERGNVTDPDQRFLLRVAQRDDTHPFAKVVRSGLYYAADWPDFAGDPDWLSRLTPIEGGSLSPRGFRSLAGYDDAAGEWFQVCQGPFGDLASRGREIVRYASPDLKHWEDPVVVLPIQEDEGRDERDFVEYMNMYAYRVGGARAGCWLGQLEIFHSDRSDPRFQMPANDNVWRKGTVELRLVVSRDAGRTWRRVGGQEAWLPFHAEEHGYDRLVFAGQPVRVGDELWFYYPAWDGDHLVFNRDGSLYEPGFLRTGRTARATLRLDGYVSLDADADGGELVTRLLVVGGPGLTLNLSAPRGQMQVELLDEQSQAIPGYAIADCRPVARDGITLPIHWTDDRDLRGLTGRPVRLRFVLRDAAFYGFRFTS